MYVKHKKKCNRLGRATETKMTVYFLNLLVTQVRRQTRVVREPRISNTGKLLSLPGWRDTKKPQGQHLLP